MLITSLAYAAFYRGVDPFFAQKVAQGGLLVNQNYRVGIIFHIIKCAAATASVGEKRTFKLARIGAFWGKFFENNLV